MARSEIADPLQNCRFRMVASGGQMAFQSPTQPGGEAGFQTITTPELSVPEVTYREGHYKYTRKFPGIPEFSSVTATRGLAVRDTSFFDWAQTALGGRAYRTDVTIFHYQHLEVATEEGPNSILPSGRRMICRNCLPTRVKISSDLDASSAEVSITEIDFAVESVDVETP